MKKIWRKQSLFRILTLLPFLLVAFIAKWLDHVVVAALLAVCLLVFLALQKKDNSRRVAESLIKGGVVSDEFLAGLFEKKSPAEVVDYGEKGMKPSHINDLEFELLQNQTMIVMLQSQINPHFLYNTLDCIRGEAVLLGAEELANMTKALSRFFSYSISKSGPLVTIKEELENVENYFLIQQFRFNQRFRLDIECDRQDAEIMENIIPRLTLQPIVENAISHGFADRIENCRISLSVFKTEDSVYIRCSDNGSGMSLQDLEHLLQVLENQELSYGKKNSQEIHGLGLANIQKRIRLLVGDDYGLHVSSMEGAGTDVEIRLPLQNKLIDRVENTFQPSQA